MRSPVPISTRRAVKNHLSSLILPPALVAFICFGKLVECVPTPSMPQQSTQLLAHVFNSSMQKCRRLQPPPPRGGGEFPRRRNANGKRLPPNLFLRGFHGRHSNRYEGEAWDRSRSVDGDSDVGAPLETVLSLSISSPQRRTQRTWESITGLLDTASSLQVVKSIPWLQVMLHRDGPREAIR